MKTYEVNEEKLTKIAYDYAVKKKKVNQGVIEAYKSGFSLFENLFRNLTAVELLEYARDKYRDQARICDDLGYSGAMRGPNDEEKKEVKNRQLISELILKITSSK